MRINPHCNRAILLNDHLLLALMRMVTAFAVAVLMRVRCAIRVRVFVRVIWRDISDVYRLVFVVRVLMFGIVRRMRMRMCRAVGVSMRMVVSFSFFCHEIAPY